MQTIIPLITVMIATVLGYYSGRMLETRKQLNVQKAQAYSDYLKALATSATDQQSAFAMGADAKTRMCIYGSPSVLRQLSDFEQAGAMAATDEGRRAIGKLVTAMRSDIARTRNQINETDLHHILFGSR